MPLHASSITLDPLQHHHVVNGTVPRLLFLIADTGGGHRASATAVAHYLTNTHPGEFAIDILDPFAGTSPRLLGNFTKLYGPLIQKMPWIWGSLYHATNSAAVVGALRGSILRTVKPGIGAAVGRLRPAAVVSFHPLLNHVAVDVVREAGGHRAPVITVITDLVDIHASWICPDVDAIVVPSPGGFDQCRRAGAHAGHVFPLGLSVDPAFTVSPPAPAAKTALRQRLGLDPTRICVLLCGGADGSGGLDRRARAIVHAGFDLELVVICGRNRTVWNRLQGLRHADGRAVHVHGFVSNMADFMHAADVLVTKAGPSTIAEALCCGLPMLLTWHLPGQERGNVDWVVAGGAGLYVPRPDELIDTLAELLIPGSKTLTEMRAATHAAARPRATGEIGELIVRSACRVSREL